MMDVLLRKLCSRKLWMALAGVITGIAMVFGVEESAVATIAGGVTALFLVVSYFFFDGIIDADAAKTAADQVRYAVELGSEKAVKPTFTGSSCGWTH